MDSGPTTSLKKHAKYQKEKENELVKQFLAWMGLVIVPSQWQWLGQWRGFGGALVIEPGVLFCSGGSVSFAGADGQEMQRPPRMVLRNGDNEFSIVVGAGLPPAWQAPEERRAESRASKAAS